MALRGDEAQTVMDSTFLFLLFALSSSVDGLGLKKAPSSTSFQVLPSRIDASNVFQRCPQTLARRLFSSAPVREYALNNVSLSLTGELLFLTGPSGCGKSTLLRCIEASPRQQPTRGTICISSVEKMEPSLIDGHQGPSAENPTTNASSCTPAKPIYLDRRPPYESHRTLLQLVQLRRPVHNDEPSVCSELFRYLAAEVFDLPPLDCTDFWNRHSIDVTPSEFYRFHLLLASVESMLTNCRQDDNNSVGHSLAVVPAPVLLLDEWLETETSAVISKVLVSLTKLTRAGAVCCVATHKLERWNAQNHSHMNMLSGSVVSLRQPD